MRKLAPPLPRAETAAYKRRMKAFWQMWHDAAFADLRVAYRSDTRTDTRDNVLQATFRQLFQNARIEDFLRRLAEGVDARGRRYTQRVLRIAPTPYDRDARIEEFVRQNVALITKLGDEQAEELETLFGNLAGSGVRHEEIAKRLQERLEVGESRALLIARDQTAKLNAQMLRARHQAAGIEEYIWSTSRDADVRDMHAELDGTRHRYDDPPITDKKGNRNNPGEDFQCRCVAIPVVPLFDEGA
jgi:SPP1 gp7 family putative phage head morphogenesis protein